MSNKTIGREPILEIGGKKYRLSKFDRDVLERFLDYANEVLPDPIDLVREKLAGFPEKIQEMMVRDALDKAALKRSFNSPDVQSLLHTPEGSFKVFALLFNKYHADLTDKDIKELFNVAAEEHGNEYISQTIQQASGVLPEGETDVQRAYLEQKGLLKTSKKK